MPPATELGGRVGLIGDVHAEDVLLERALDELTKLGARTILCTGDIVDGQGSAERCRELLEARNVLTVRGNHDRWISKGTLRTLPNATRRAELSDRTLDYLRVLPPTLAFESTLGSVLLCHGLGSDDMARVGIDDYGYALESNDALQGLRASSHELVLCGHTHHAHLHTFAELRLLNAGTLVRDQHPCFVLLDFDAPSAGIYDLGATTSPRTQHAL